MDNNFDKNNIYVLNKILDEISDGVLIARQDNKKFVYANNTICKMLGYSKSEILELGVDDIHPKEILNDVYQEISLQINGKKLIAKELPINRKDGSIFYGEISSVPIIINKNPYIIGCFRDVTERNLFEREIEKSQKLESLGVLAGGIAHDFNNILTAIMGNISLALYSDSREELKQYLKDAEKALKRAKKLTHQLLTFAKGGEPIIEISSIKEVIIESADFISSGSNVICKYSIPDDLWLVDIDKGQISQVIQNLVLNAIEAMNSGGNIWLKAENKFVKFDRDLNPLKDKTKESKYIKISIIDQGIGIKKEEIKKIFDPYYTTKDKGSGLGLAIVYSIIKRHNGIIKVKSEVGVGTQFDIYLPASSKFVDDIDKIEKKSNIIEENLICDEGRVLIVDDDKSILKTLSEMLSKIGIESVSAENGETAIELCKQCLQSGLKFKFIILDLTIPGDMGGIEILKSIKEIDPEVKAIISSGYSKINISNYYKKYGFVGILPKPYTFDDLKKMIKDIL